MNANGLKFAMMAERHQWRTLPNVADESPATLFDPERRVLRLANKGRIIPLVDLSAAEEQSQAEARLEWLPMALDRFGTRAFWDEPTGQIKATGAIPGPSTINIYPLSTTPTDLAMGYDGILYIAANRTIVMVDRRNRWPAHTISLTDFNPWRLAADPEGGIWALDRDNNQIGRLQGEPLPSTAQTTFDPDTFRPIEENRNPPRLKLIETGLLLPTEKPVSIATNQVGKVAILLWNDETTDDEGRVKVQASARLLKPDQTWSQPIGLKRARFPYSLNWVNDTSLALMLVGLPTEAPVFDIDTTSMGVTVDPNGNFYPLKNSNGHPFLNGVTQLPHYQIRDEEASKGIQRSHPLHHLSLLSYQTHGMATSRIPLDSGKLGAAWHRLFLEACIPVDCGIQLFLAATDDVSPPPWNLPESMVNEGSEWHEHLVGRRFTQRPDTRIPLAVWEPFPSEIPHHPGFISLGEKDGLIKNEKGLFSVLIMRPKRHTRTLRGRFLHARVMLIGEGRSSPEIFALRAYSSRFSYAENYLPALYRERLFGADGDAISQTSTPADFLERMLNNFEGVLTRMEDQIAHSYLITDPRTAQPEALDWLGRWIGMTFETALPNRVKRRLLETAPELYQRRGTLAGLTLALDLATEGRVSLGQIIIVENWRLRRTFSTILGANLADEEDPLTGSFAVSGNSIVGDTLFLGDEADMDFLALFSADLEVTNVEQQTISEFLDNQAFRVTILVHEAQTAQLSFISRIVELHAPAHLEVTVIGTNYAFLVGTAGLIGIDSYLMPDSQPEPVQLNESILGVRDLLRRPPSLDSRLEHGVVG